jgi:hypothetical protein
MLSSRIKVIQRSLHMKRYRSADDTRRMSAHKQRRTTGFLDHIGCKELEINPIATHLADWGNSVNALMNRSYSCVPPHKGVDSIKYPVANAEINRDPIRPLNS